MSTLPAGRGVLAGKRVLVTRAAAQAGKLSAGLRALGVEPVEVPVLEMQPPADPAPLDRALRALDAYDWLILSSANAVSALAWSGLSDRMTCLKVAAVGESTAAAAREAGLPVALVPEKYVAESLVDAMLQRTREEAATQNLTGLRFLLARAEVARDVIPEALRAAGAEVDVVDAYRNAMPKDAPKLLCAAMAQGVDAATFTSSSSAKHLADAARAAGIDFPLIGVRAISIGPVTSQTLRELGWEPAAEAAVFDIPGLIAAVERVLRA